jgi:hypothetical protein
VEVGELDEIRRELDDALGGPERGPLVARAGGGVVEDGGGAGVDGAVGTEEERRGTLTEAGHNVLDEAQHPRVAPARLVDLGERGVHRGPAEAEATEPCGRGAS